MADFVQAHDLKTLQRILGKCPDEARVAVRRGNRQASAFLRGKIRADMVVAGGTVQHRSPASHARKPKKAGSRSGAMRASVASFAGVDYAGVRGGGARAPHFAVNEFGGSVWWEKGAQGGRRGAARRTHRSFASQIKGTGGGRGHIIPVRERSPMNHIKTWTTGSRSGARVTKSKAFPSGWYFYESAAEHLGEAVQFHAERMAGVMASAFRPL